jgi:prophage maintenance system killer protein
MALKYLTVQDILWINLQSTHKVLHYHFAKLEEGTFYQYAYGASADLVSQAPRFLTGFARLRPFEFGNVATAFIAFAAFVELNGHTLELNDREAQAWALDAIAGKVSVGDKIGAADHEAHHEGPTDVRGKVREILERYPETIQALAAQDSVKQTA